MLHLPDPVYVARGKYPIYDMKTPYDKYGREIFDDETGAWEEPELSEAEKNYREEIRKMHVSDNVVCMKDGIDTGNVLRRAGGAATNKYNVTEETMLNVDEIKQGKWVQSFPNGRPDRLSGYAGWVKDGVEIDKKVTYEKVNEIVDYAKEKNSKLKNYDPRKERAYTPLKELDDYMYAHFLELKDNKEVQGEVDRLVEAVIQTGTDPKKYGFGYTGSTSENYVRMRTIEKSLQSLTGLELRSFNFVAVNLNVPYWLLYECTEILRVWEEREGNREEEEAVEFV